MSIPSRQVSLKGSCHCGAIQYILRLMHPHVAPSLSGEEEDTQEIYRCNCTVCHKTGQFHVRPREPAADFLLLSPLDPFGELGDYQCFGKKLHFFFCRTCGVRPFIFAGASEVAKVSSAEVGMSDGRPDAAANKSLNVWRPRRGDDVYLSVNGHTIEANQEEFEMRVLTEKKQVLYVDCLSDPEGPATYERPHNGGCY